MTYVNYDVDVCNLWRFGILFSSSPCTSWLWSYPIKIMTNEMRLNPKRPTGPHVPCIQAAGSSGITATQPTGVLPASQTNQSIRLPTNHQAAYQSIRLPTNHQAAYQSIRLPTNHQAAYQTTDQSPGSLSDYRPITGQLISPSDYRPITGQLISVSQVSRQLGQSA